MNMNGNHTGTVEGLMRSEEHTSELQSRSDLVCRLLLEKKKKILEFYPRFCPNRVCENHRATALIHGIVTQASAVHYIAGTLALDLRLPAAHPSPKLAN